jgi:hypothetical protein
MLKKLFNVVSLVGNWNRILYLPGTGNIKHRQVCMENTHTGREDGGKLLVWKRVDPIGLQDGGSFHGLED